MAQIAMLVAMIACIFGATQVWLPSKKSRKTFEKIGISVFFGAVALICGMIAVAPDATLSMFGYGH